MPGVVVATTEFAAAVHAQADALGVAVRAVYVPHPVAALTDEELGELAAASVDQVAAALTRGDEA